MRWILMAATVLWGCGTGGSSGSPDGDHGSGVDDPTGIEDTDLTGDPTDVPAGTPTWYQDVAPLLADRCGSCHRPGGIAPFSVATYEEALPWGPAMADAIQAGTMPPFHAVDDELCDVRLDWKDDLSLSDEEKQLVYDWVAADMPEGDPANAAAAELRPVESLEDYDVELQIQEPFAVDGTDDIYQCFRIPLPNNVPMWLTGFEMIPDNDLVVHHVIVWSDPNDSSAGQAGSDGSYGCSGFPDIIPTEIVGTWTPGVQPMVVPEGTGIPMEVGGSLVLNIHYHPTGASTEFDRSSIRLRWTDQEPDQYASWFLVDIPFGATVEPGPNDQGGSEFRIPAGVPDHLETVELKFYELLFSADMTVFAITPHMHYLGTDMLVTIEHSDALPNDCLIHAPGFRFDWQRDYTYDAATGPLPVIHPGDRVRVQCQYDNSASNPFLQDHLSASGATAPHDVYWGEETGDEMCMAIVGLIVPKSGWSPFSWF